MSDYQKEIEKMRLYVKRLGKPIQSQPRQKRQFIPYSDRIKRRNIVFNSDNDQERILMDRLSSEQDKSTLIKQLLKKHYNL